MMRNARFRGYLFAASASLTSGMAYVVGKWTLQFISPPLMTAGMFTLASAVVSAFWLRPSWRSRELRSGSAWRWALAFSGMGFLAVLTFWYGIQNMDPALASFLNRTEVFVTVGLAMVFLQERFRGRELWGAALSLAGIVVMRFTLRSEYDLGFWLVLGGAVFFGATEFVAKLAIRHVSVGFLTWARSLIMAAAFWAVVLARNESWTGLGTAWPGIVGVALLGPLLARVSYLQALRLLPLSSAAVINQTQPVVVLALAGLWLHQVPAWRELAGGILILIGCTNMILAAARPTA